MRELADSRKVRAFVEELGRACTGPGRVYLVGGATAVLYGWRGTTVDIDLKLDPEPAGAFGAIRLLKEQLNVSVELASPDAFVPPIPGWQERSPVIDHVGLVEFRHFDLYTQAFAKIERGHERDESDVRAMIARGLVNPSKLRESIHRAIEQIERYPHLDATSLSAKVEAFLVEIEAQNGTA